MKNWTSKAVALMHEYKITQIEIAKKLGVTNDYVSMIMLGKRTPKNAETRIMSAIREIMEDRKNVQV